MRLLLTNPNSNRVIFSMLTICFTRITSITSSSSALNMSSTASSTSSSDEEKPFNFSWAIPGLLAGSGFPKTLANLRFIANSGVDILVTLNAERKPPVDAFNAAATAAAEDANATATASAAPRTLDWVKVDIVDFASPTRDQIDRVMQTIEKAEKEGKKVCIHCTMGQGRTGSMIACWLARSRGLTGEDAIRYLGASHSKSCLFLFILLT